MEESWQVQQADAFVNMMNGFLCDQSSAEDKVKASPSDNYLVTIHVDQSALTGSEGRSALPIESVKRLCCDSHTVIITENTAGEPLSIGRKTRIVPTAIKRAVLARYHHCCAFPGCHNRRFLHVHHIEHWSNGGETCLDNLMPLCTRHHPLVHEGRFRVERDYRNEWIFVRPDGQVIPPNGYLLQDMVDEVYEKSSAEDLLVAAVSEPSPPAYWH